MKLLRKILKFSLLCLEAATLFVLLANIWVIALTHGRTYTKISRVPPRPVALVLGTSPKTRSGNVNPYFISRMDAAGLLYHFRKVQQILVSGEKSAGYDEPAAMRSFLVSEKGINSFQIMEDPEGFNTRASLRRCQEVYKINDVIIVSQGYHNLRALFYARNLGMNAIAFDARPITAPESYYRNQFREVLARVQAVVFYLTGLE